MTRYRRKNRRNKPQGVVSASRVNAYRSSSHAKRRSANEIVSMRSRRQKSGFGVFLRRNLKLVAIAGFVVVVGVIALLLFVGGKDTTTGAKTASVDPVQSPTTNTPAVASDEGENNGDIGDFDEEKEYSYEGVDQSILEGMDGSNDSLFSANDSEMADELFAEEGIRIGITIGDLKSDSEQILLSKLEEVSSAAEADKKVYEVYYYNAAGDYNQQLQDVRSLIKNEVDVIIIGATEKKRFDMVVSMAEDANIPVVAYNAPDTTGYVINVVSDEAAWGNAYGTFMATNLTEGKIVQILGNEESEIDQKRAAAINSALQVNENISMAETGYAKWDKEAANEVMTGYLEKLGKIDGIITEEGMAQGILEAAVDAKKLPTVICGDATAGFIKMWYALKNEGIDITPPPEDGEEVDENAPKVMFKAEEGELIACAQPAPVYIGAAAFEIALKIAEGRTLKAPGSTFTYAVDTMITEDNLVQYYEMVKDKSDSYTISDMVSEETLETLFNPQTDSAQ